jgi:ankyrin repeat protein
MDAIEVKRLFALADADDVEGLRAALGSNLESFNVHSESGETLYLHCVFRGKAKCTAALEKRGRLSLHEAALAGDAARVDALAQAAPWSVDTLSADGWTALHLAAFLGRDAALEGLLAHGADARIFSRATEQNLPLHAAAAGRKLGKAAFAKLIVATGEPDALQKQGLTALMIAAGNAFTDAVDALLAAGADRHLKAPDGKTAADFARERGHTALAERLG